MLTSIWMGEELKNRLRRRRREYAGADEIIPEKKRLMSDPERFESVSVEKVSKIVKKQLSLKDDQRIVAETKFTDLGADSIGTKIKWRKLLSSLMSSCKPRSNLV
ncbi:hypothetical protein F2Q68_00015387 [Brassica cretica]|uniref:Carrier domain-containing protein n=1 Tax=Brassica cretica TaxID=69181 RepID=A0A8S9H834_BRACR|nr:hypothetical protein F2Q68_00015387 [Brassica cretica]